MAVWVASHYFTGHLCHEAIEIIVAYEYLNPTTLHAPSSAMLGLYHALVRLSGHDWEADPLILDLSRANGDEGISGLTRADRLSVVDQFRAMRSSSSALSSSLNATMYIVTSCDKLLDLSPFLLSHRSPEKVVLKMMVSAAEASASQLLQWMKMTPSPSSSSSALPSLSSIMSSHNMLASCNVVFQFHKSLFNPDVERGPPMARVTILSNLSASELSVGSLVVRESMFAANPSQEFVFNKLRQHFKDDALFFWNGVTGRELGLVWRPKLFLPQKFSILNSKNRVAVGEGGDSDDQAHIVLPNIAEIISKIIAASDGLLTKAVVK